VNESELHREANLCVYIHSSSRGGQGLMQRIQSTESMPAASAVGFSMRMLMRKNRRVKWKCQTMGWARLKGSAVYVCMCIGLYYKPKERKGNTHTRVYTITSHFPFLWYSQKPFLLFFLLRKRVCIEKRLLPIADLVGKKKKDL
jgi:hypothetical protein